MPRQYSTADYVLAGVAGLQARMGVRAAGGTSQAETKAAYDAFTNHLQEIGKQSQSAGLHLDHLNTALNIFRFHAINAVQPVHLLQQAIGAFQAQVIGFVEKANPAAVMRFTMATEDLYGVIGRMLVPMLNTVREIILRLADHLNAMTGPAKQMMAALAGTTVGLALATTAIIAFAAAVALTQDVLSGGVLVIFQVAGALFGMAAGASLAAGSVDQFRQLIDAIMPQVNAMMDEFGRILMPGIRDGLTYLIPLFRLMALGMEVMRPVLDLFIERMQLIRTVMIIWITVLVEVWTAFFRMLGLIGAPQAAPARAPAAVRQVQTGSMESLLSAQYQRSLQGARQDETNPVVDKLEKIRVLTEQIQATVARIEQYRNTGRRVAPDALSLIPPVLMYRMVREGIRNVAD